MLVVSSSSDTPEIRSRIDWVCAKIPVNSTFKQDPKGTEIIIYSNGVHLDIGLKREDLRASKFLGKIGGNSTYIFTKKPLY